MGEVAWPANLFDVFADFVRHTVDGAACERRQVATVSSILQFGLMAGTGYFNNFARPKLGVHTNRAAVIGHFNGGIGDITVKVNHATRLRGMKLRSMDRRWHKRTGAVRVRVESRMVRAGTRLHVSTIPVMLVLVNPRCIWCVVAY